MKLRDKMKSRKFIAWVVWTVLVLALMLIGGITKTDMPLSEAIGWYGGITLLYMGVQGAQDFASKLKDKDIRIPYEDLQNGGT